MSLVDALGYQHRTPTTVHRGVQRLAATRAGSWTLARTSPGLDRWAFRRSDGRWTFTSALAALPVILLTTVGARSGLERHTPLVGIPYDDDLAVIGSGYGQTATPAWVHNLRANPTARVGYRDRSIDVMAGETDDPDPIWERAQAAYPGFAAYPVRASHRTIAVFLLSSGD